MPLSVKYDILEETKFQYPFRIFVSGSSQSGKTYLSEQILKSSIFMRQAEHIMYYHPDYLDECPVTWHQTLTTSVSYHCGVPTLKNLCDLKPNTCIVLDDLYEECVSSKSIDYLFRVLSGKKQLSVIILSQRYFAHGKFAMNIRNNCNFTILLRNVDKKINYRIASLMSLQIPVKKAITDSYEGNFWPYIFIDSSPRAQVTGYRVYTNIFGKYLTVYSDDGMKSYVVSEKDFLKFFIVKEKGLAQTRDVGSISPAFERAGTGQVRATPTVGNPTDNECYIDKGECLDPQGSDSEFQSSSGDQEKNTEEAKEETKPNDSEQAGETSRTDTRNTVGDQTESRAFKRAFDYAERAKRNRLRRKIANVVPRR